MKFLHKTYNEQNQEMYKNKYVEEFIKTGNLSELNLIDCGPHAFCYEFFDGVTNEDFDISATNTVLLVSNEYTARDLNDLQQKTIPLAKGGINIAPVIQYSPLKEFVKKSQFDDSVIQNKLYMMGIVQPRVYGMKAFTPTIEDTIRKFNFLNNLTPQQAIKAFSDVIKIIKSGIKLDMENPKNIIINRYGVHFIDYEPSKDIHNLLNNPVYVVETLIEFFNHLVGTHAYFDKLSFDKPRYIYFSDSNKIFDEEQRDNYQTLQSQVFYKFSKALLISAYRSKIEGAEMLATLLKSYELNYFEENNKSANNPQNNLDDAQLI